MNSNSQSLLQNFASAWSPAGWKDVTAVVGVSGGSDSVALLRLMTETVRTSASGVGKIVVGHFDHGWREDSAQDAEFVSALADSLSLPCVIGRAEETQVTSDGQDARDLSKTEQRARELRYDFLTRVCADVGARYLVVAHTADDQVETALHHVIRGSGLRGLGGMRRTRVMNETLTLVRPLLEFRRSALREFLRDLGQSFRVDASNYDERYTRVKIRNELLPKLREYNKEVENSVLRLSQLARETQEEIESSANRLLNRVIKTRTDSSVTVDTTKLAAATPFSVRETLAALWREFAWPLQEMNFEKWNALEQFVRGGEKAVMMPGEVHVLRLDDATIKFSTRCNS